MPLLVAARVFNLYSESGCACIATLNRKVTSFLLLMWFLCLFVSGKIGFWWIRSQNPWATSVEVTIGGSSFRSLNSQRVLFCGTDRREVLCMFCRLWRREPAQARGCDTVPGVRVSHPLQEAHPPKYGFFTQPLNNSGYWGENWLWPLIIYVFIWIDNYLL